MNTLELEPLKTTHLDEVLALNQASLPHVNSLLPADLEHLRFQAHYASVAVFNGRLAGFLIALDPAACYDSPNYLWFCERYLSFLYIDRMVIAPEARRNGVGLHLYQKLEAHARDKGIPILTCEYNLRPLNSASRLFHEECGFFEVGRQETEHGAKTVSLQIKHVDLS